MALLLASVATSTTPSARNTDNAQKPDQKCGKFEILKQYIDPIMYLLILVVGISGNGMLLFIYIRHRELRTAANVMIIHLAICDIINLSINAPLHLSFKYDNGSCETQTNCGVVQAIKMFLRGTAALAVITLIIQRFIITHSVFNRTPSNRRSTFTFNVLSIITVWVLPLSISLPVMYDESFCDQIFTDKKDENFRYATVLSLVLYCLIMPSLMFGFSTQIARRLKQSVKNIPGEFCQRMLQKSRIKSARMMIALAVVFVITYFPFYVWVLLVRFVGVDKNSPITIYAHHFTKQLLFANGCFNPIAMFAVSSKLRKLLVRHVSYSSGSGVYSTRL